MVRIGSVAPDFEVKLHTGVRFRLSDQRGERIVVLYFYPRDFTWGCTKEGCMFAEHIQEIKKLDATVIGINGQSLADHKKFAKQYNFPFPLGSDPDLSVCRNYRVLWLRGLAIRRATYIIDKHQTVRGVAHHEFLIDRHWKYVLRVLKGLKEEEEIKTFNRQAWDL
ncbi:MAG: Thiol peroxidase, Bcp-type [Bacteroidetes bacterium]|nr:Thiol peroxidase, Bcp-type [Bacteroidota bacterium]